MKGEKVCLTCLEAKIYEAIKTAAEKVIDGKPKRIATALMDLAQSITKVKHCARRSLDSLLQKGMVVPLADSKVAREAVPCHIATAQIDKDSPGLYAVLEIKYRIGRENMAKNESGRKRSVLFAAGDMRKIFDHLKAMADEQGRIVNINPRLRAWNKGLSTPERVKAAKVWLEEEGLIRVIDRKTIELTGKVKGIPTDQPISVKYVSMPKESKQSSGVPAPPPPANPPKSKWEDTTSEEIDRLLKKYNPSEGVRHIALKVMEMIGKEGSIISLREPLMAAGLKNDAECAGAATYLVSIGRVKRVQRQGIYLVLPSGAEGEIPMELPASAATEIEPARPIEDELFDLADQLTKLADQCRERAVALVDLRKEEEEVKAKISNTETMATDLVSKAKTMLSQ